MAGVEVRKLKTKTSYLLIYRGPDGRQVRTTARTATSLTMARKMAQAAEDQAERERLGIVPRRVERRLGEELCDRYERDAIPGFKSKAGPQSQLRKYIRPFLTGRRLDKLTPADITGWVASLKAEGLQDSSREALRVRLGAVLTFAVKQLKWLTASPMEDADKVKVPQKAPRFLTPAEVSRVLAAADEWYRPIVAVAVYCGLRKGELAGLKWEDVDLREGIITVRRSFATHTKSGKERVVGIPPELTPLLEEQRTRAREELVFPNRYGKMRSPNWGAAAQFRALLKEAGIAKDVTFRHTRSTFGTSYRRVTDIRATQRAMGHADVNITARHYDGTDMAELKANASRLSYAATHKQLTAPSNGPVPSEERESEMLACIGTSCADATTEILRPDTVTSDNLEPVERDAAPGGAVLRHKEHPASGPDSQPTHTETGPAHVFLGEGALLYCRHCGDERRLTASVDLAAAVATGNAYIAQHRGCRPREAQS